jgi:hypothetical protein
MEIYRSITSNQKESPRKTIVIFYEHLSREYDAIINIKNALLSQCQTPISVVVAQINLEWRQVLKYAKRHGISVLMLPGYYAAIPDCLWSIPFKRINKRLVTINFHHEQIPAPFNRSVQLPHDSLSKKGCVHLAWSERFKHSLEQVGVPSELIKITGNPRADLLIFNEKDTCKPDLAQKFGLDENKKWILYCDNRYGEAKQAIENQLKNTLYRDLDENLYSSKELLDDETRRLLLEQMRNLPESFFEQYELIYRPHPGVEASSDIDARVHVISDGSIGMWLGVSDLLLVWNSTTAFEADVLGVPVLRHEPVPNNPQFRAIGLDSYPLIEKLADINDRLIQETREAESAARYYQLHYGTVDGKSANRTASAVLAAMDNPPQLESAPSATSVWREYSVFALRGIVSDFMLKARLLNITKWPKSAYIHKDEVSLK